MSARCGTHPRVCGLSCWAFVRPRRSPPPLCWGSCWAGGSRRCRRRRPAILCRCPTRARVSLCPGGREMGNTCYAAMGLRRARRGSPDDSARQQQDAVHRNQELIRLRSAQICEAEHTAARLRAVLQTHQREARAHSAQPLPRERRAAVLETLRELQDTQRRITAKYHECGVLRTYLARLQGVTEQRALME